MGQIEPCIKVICYEFDREKNTWAQPSNHFDNSHFEIILLTKQKNLPVKNLRKSWLTLSLKFDEIYREKVDGIRSLVRPIYSSL